MIKEVHWSEKMKVYFEQIIRVTPSQFKNFASGSLVREIEEKTRERNATEVEEQDLVKAFLDSIPVFFRSDMIKLLKDLGINTSRPKEEQIPKNDLVKMKSDIIQAAELAEVSYNEMLLDKIMKVYEENFSCTRSSITFSTTTKRVEHRGLSVQLVDIFNKYDPFKMAKDNQLLPNVDSVVNKFMQEIKSYVPILGYRIEFGVMTGIEQIDVMCASHLPQPVERLFSLRSTPDSLRGAKQFLDKFQLKFSCMFGVNYLKGILTLQFMTKQVQKINAQYIESMLKDLGYKIPVKGVMDLCERAVMVSLDFSCTKSQPDSVSFEMVAHSIEEVPKNLNGFIENYVQNAPFKGERKKYLYIVTFTRNGQFLKLKNDYSGTAVDCITGPFSTKNFRIQHAGH